MIHAAVSPRSVSYTHLDVYKRQRLDLRPRAWITDSLIGIAISAPVYWMFTKALAISLPGLTTTGWL